MSQSNDDAEGGGCFACFGGGKKKKPQQPPKNVPVTKDEPKESKVPEKDPDLKKPDPDTKVPNFITQVDKPGQKGDSGLKLSVPSNRLSREECDINSPRGQTIQTSTKKGKSTVDDTERVPWRPDALLPPQRPDKNGMKCLILDLDETLVHSSFKEVPIYDFLVPVEIEGTTYQVYVAKRPGVDEFLKKMGECYEIVVFTASLAKYADPVLDLLDIHKVVDWRLFRESCTCIKNTYVKDMGRVGRPLKSVMIMDNSPHSYSFNPENAIPCESWFDDYTDTELLRFIPTLQDIASPSVDNVILELEKRKMNGVARLLESMESSSAQSDSSAYSIESSGSSSS
jgi:Dullard-like phosphatase family protein